ncbi:MAG TPA: CpsD/CapB family tyrosine-protein kinase [Syntrophothermus lipocalidus]|nr:CpsD/CapB family tyrosine-protein kinase [Syntrophothermus lipocalidus]
MLGLFNKNRRRRKKRRQPNTERELVTISDARSPMAEAFRTIRTNIHYASVDRELKTLLVTSPQPTEGKSTTASNLAVVMAQAGQKTLLVDCDFRRPTVHRIFNLPNTQGLTNLIAEDAPLEGMVTNSVVDNLYVLTCGPIPPNPAEMLASAKMQKFLETVAADYDKVIIDSPPTGAVTDALILSSMVDGVILVVKSGETVIQAAKDAKEKLTNANAHILGVIINGIKESEGGYYYYYYYGDDGAD